MTAEERARLERVAIGQICGCRTCLCCAEYMASRGRRVKHAPACSFHQDAILAHCDCGIIDSE